MSEYDDLINISDFDYIDEIISDYDPFIRFLDNTPMSAFSIKRGGVQFPTTKESNVKTKEEILAQAQALREQAEELEARVTAREQYGEDPFKNGDVIKVSMKYRGSRITYSYAVVKTAGQFYLSGKMGGSGDPERAMSWENFVAWLAQGDASVWIAKSLTKVY